MKYENVKLIDKKVYEENNKLYLCLTYEYVDDKGKYTIYIPKIDLSIRTNKAPSIEYEKLMNNGCCISRYGFLNTDEHRYCMYSKDDETDPYFYKIETKEKKMTIEEIEKELGYKVQIVSKKEY